MLLALSFYFQDFGKLCNNFLNLGEKLQFRLNLFISTARAARVFNRNMSDPVLYLSEENTWFLLPSLLTSVT